MGYWYFCEKEPMEVENWQCRRDGGIVFLSVFGRMQQERLSVSMVMGNLSIVIREERLCGHRCRWGCVVVLFGFLLLLCRVAYSGWEICRNFYLFSYLIWDILGEKILWDSENFLKQRTLCFVEERKGGNFCLEFCLGEDLERKLRL